MCKLFITFTKSAKVTTFVALDGTVIAQTEEPLIIGRRP